MISDDGIRGLTLKQPWADMLLGLVPGVTKRIENRSWTTRYRGWLIVHSGVRVDNAFADARRHAKGALGVAQLHGVHPATDDCADRPRVIWGGCTCVEVGGHLGAGGVVLDSAAYHWEFGLPLVFPEPIPCSGAMTLWRPPPRVEVAAVALINKEEER